MRSLVVALTIFLVVSVAHAHLRSKHKRQDNEPQKVLLKSGGKSFPARIKLKSFSQTAAEEEKPEYVVPQYKAASIEKPNPSVTEGFCKKMLKDVQAQEAPYFLEGEFTGESRKEILTQCGQRICTWGQEIAKAASKSSCGARCPTSCASPKAFVRLILDDSEKLGQFVSSLLALTAKHMGKHAKKAVKMPEPQEQEKNIAEEEETEQEAEEEVSSNPSVTKEFCSKVLEEVKNKQPPYFIKNHETGVDEPTEFFRTGLAEQCGARVCGWLQKYKKHLKGCGNECQKCGPEGLHKLKEAHHLVPLLQKIVTLIQKHPAPAPVVEAPKPEPEEEEPQEVLPSANDPRDPAFATGPNFF